MDERERAASAVLSPVLLAWHGHFVLAHKNSSIETHPLCLGQSSMPAVHRVPSTVSAPPLLRLRLANSWIFICACIYLCEIHPVMAVTTAAAQDPEILGKFWVCMAAASAP